MNDLISEYQQYESIGVDDCVDEDDSEEFSEFPTDRRS